MVQEAYVSYEVAKLLKEKGFNESVRTFYTSDGKFEYCAFELNHNLDIGSGFTSAPTHQMAMAWLREEKNIDIFPWLYHKDFEGNLTYSVSVYDHGCEIMIPRFYDEKYENIIEAALKYALDNLL